MRFITCLILGWLPLPLSIFSQILPSKQRNWKMQLSSFFRILLSRSGDLFSFSSWYPCLYSHQKYFLVNNKSCFFKYVTSYFVNDDEKLTYIYVMVQFYHGIISFSSLELCTFVLFKWYAINGFVASKSHDYQCFCG